MSGESILKKTILAGIGIYSLTKDKAQEIMQELVKQGELAKEEGPKFVKAMMDKADEELTYVRQFVDNRINETLEKFRPSYEEELKKLNQKIDKLTKEVEKLRK